MLHSKIWNLNLLPHIKYTTLCLPICRSTDLFVDVDLFAIFTPAPAWPLRDAIDVSVSSSLCQKILTYVSYLLIIHLSIIYVFVVALGPCGC